MCTHACAREVCYPGLSEKATVIEEGYLLVGVGPGSGSGWQLGVATETTGTRFRRDDGSAIMYAVDGSERRHSDMRG